VENEPFFSGSALAAVAHEGAMHLPDFVMRSLAPAEGRRLVVGAHQLDSCLTVYTPAHRSTLHRELERRRLEDGTAAPAAHHRRCRRTFGLSEEAGVDDSGRVVLPPMLRRRGAIGATALVIGTGREIEIWSIERALEAPDEDLRTLAAWRLEARDEES
jgi:MraZ protein